MVSIEWLTAPFLWEESLKDTNNKRFKQPAILRFDNDSFMEEMLDILDKDPSMLKDYVARYETWRNKSVGWLPENKIPSILKLYQPAHGFFYLIAAELVCRRYGFPDKKVDTSQNETSSFVIRRLVPFSNTTLDPKNPVTFTEYAFIGGSWRKASPNSVSSEEEHLPLFSVNYTQEGKKRRVMAGSIPVSAREKYQAEPKFSVQDTRSTDSGDTLANDPRIVLFNTKVTGAMQDLSNAINQNNMDEKQAHEIFLYIISDLAEFLQKYLADVWDAIHLGSWNGKVTDRKYVFERLRDAYFSSGHRWEDILNKYKSDIPIDKSDIASIVETLSLDNIKNSITSLNPWDLSNHIVLDPLPDPRLDKFDTYVADKLLELSKSMQEMSDEQARQSFFFIVLDFAQFLNEYLPNVWEALKSNNWTGTDNSEKRFFNWLENAGFYAAYHWGDALREVWDKKINAISGEVKGPIASGLTSNKITEAINNLGITDSAYRQSNFYVLVNKAISESGPLGMVQEMTNVDVDVDAGALYFLRCVYERPQCKKISPPIISEPSQIFQFAPFYDPDAPGRPLKITMPTDTSIEGLRKYPKNVSFQISEKLRAQMEQLKDISLEKLDKGEVGKKGKFDFGMICSFSIPIITICAFLFLMIIVKLLNIIFWWMAFFKICIPVPKLRK